MLDLFIQLAAACGPIALAVMGVIVSLSPPSGSRKAHRIWAGAFAVVGILSASAIFFELRGTDQILGQIWEHIKKPQAPPVVAKTGARLFFRVDGFKKGDKTLAVNMSNGGDVMARTGSLVGSYYTLVDHILSEKEEDANYEVTLKSPPRMGVGIEIPINVGRAIDLEINLTDAQYDSIVNGTMHFYLFVVAVFRDELTPSGKTNLSSVCTHFTKNTTAGLVCLSHTESRLEN
jgi:hypothetical protein